MDAPRRHLCAKVEVLIDHLREAPVAQVITIGCPRDPHLHRPAPIPRQAWPGWATANAQQAPHQAPMPDTDTHAGCGGRLGRSHRDGLSCGICGGVWMGHRRVSR